MRLLVPQGIGDSLWALTKVRSVARRHAVERGERVDVLIACWDVEGLEARGLEFVRRFEFVDSAEMLLMPRDGRRGPVLLPGPATDGAGRYRYVPSGLRGGYDGYDFVLVPNGDLERGRRLEDWLPGYEADWDVMGRFQFRPEEVEAAASLRSKGAYAVCYLGPLAGNTTSGHNRGPLWAEGDWHEVFRGLLDLHLRVVVMGAEYDRSYWERLLPRWQGERDVIDLVGRQGIGEAVATLKAASACVSYQSGIGISAAYLGVPTTVFWRPDGDSISPPPLHLSFDERMASGWAPPSVLEAGTLLSAIYGRHGPSDVLEFVGRKARW